jgi:hypothetical protein
MAYVAVRISVNKPSGKKGTSNVREALRLVMDQVKILLENLQMVYPSIIFFPHQAKGRVVVESDLIATSEHVHDNCDFMHGYFPQFYVNKHDTYMYSNMIMAYNTPPKSYSGKAVTSCMGITMPCIPENCKLTTVLLWDPFYTPIEICRVKG